ncbi:MAG: acylneuraminate cytidylyltransferase family protein [Candidatus Marinimicrobia bacterium]|nr:acylneuraminate cytidylyltransferase family protein [Candidatus Neomarinimicrobiota bacterium]
MENKKFLGVIPARSGSKGIKNKNIRSFCGKPLLAHTIVKAKRSKYLDRVLVSTDSEEYAKMSLTHWAEVPFLRPKYLSSDNSLIADVIVHLLGKLEEQEGYKPDYVVLIQTTSPLSTHKDIDACIEAVMNSECDGVMTMVPRESLLYTTDKNGYLKLLYNKDWLEKTNRQSVPRTYQINGPAVVIASVESFLKNKSFLAGKIFPVFMEKWRSVDLDTEEDFLLAELIYKNRKMFERRV